MSGYTPTRDDAFKLLREYNENPALINHALSVEAVMRYFARTSGYASEEEKWGIVGLIHDLDYERYPEEHCVKTGEILTERGWPEEYLRAAVSHGWEICVDVEPRTVMEKTLFAIDELTGLVTASALVRPSRSVMDMEVRSVKKKWKDRSFSAGVDRDVILKGCSLLGMELDELIEKTIMGMREVANEIGL
jgi:predicted hydrolase (HD superfamily)